jgi:hypothetical protein
MLLLRSGSVLGRGKARRGTQVAANVRRVAVAVGRRCATHEAVGVVGDGCARSGDGDVEPRGFNEAPGAGDPLHVGSRLRWALGFTHTVRGNAVIASDSDSATGM